MAEIDPLWLETMGYRDVVRRGGRWCGILRFHFTTAIVVGLDEIGYSHRYCYEHDADAQTALAAWDGCGHPGGPWIKCKGAGTDLLNPALTA